ncbi:WD40 repeat-like protein [Trichoderma novae-zelandiae]
MPNSPSGSISNGENHLHSSTCYCKHLLKPYIWDCDRPSLKMSFQKLTTKFKVKFDHYRSRSRSPSLRDGPLQSPPSVQASISAPSATSDSPKSAPIAAAEEIQNRHSLPILTINEPAPEQESCIQDPPAAEHGDDDEEGKIAETPSDEIWDLAYDELKVEEPALVQAYERILTTQLLDQDDAATEVIGEVNHINQHDKDKRRSQMQQLVKSGLDNVSRETKMKSRIGDLLPIVSLSKSIVADVVKGMPQAALPCAAVALSLELLTNPVSETKANCTGVAHVAEQMNWYCELALLLFGNKDGITAGTQRELCTKLIDLYKKLLSFEIKSICSYYRHRGLVFLRDLVKLDDWKGNFKEIQDAEAFFNEQLRTFQSVDLGQDVKQLVVHAKDEQAYRKTEEDKKCLRDLYITDPQMDKKRIETTKGGLVQDSWRWILNHPDFRTWLHDDDKRLLWVKGDPGKGKTMLLCGLVDEITNRVAQSDNAISYFFCQATMPTINNHLAVLRGLVWLLVDQQPSLISHVREKYDPIGKDLFEGPNAWFSLASIFRNILHDERLTTAYVIIDGLDECTTGLTELLELIQESMPLKNVKLLLSSRNWPEIQASLEGAPDAEGVNLSLEVNATLVAAAVDAYISEKASMIKFLKKNDELREKVCDLVRERANGTFLWVAIVFQQLQRVKIPYGGLSSVMERLKELPKGLTELYGRMLQQIEGLDSIEESKLCRTVLGICVVAYQPLRLQELATLAGFKDELTDPSELRILIETCGSFLTVKDETVYFIHQSSKEYLTTNSRAQSILFANGTEEIHHTMAMHSLETMGKMLCRDIYELHNHAILIDDISSPEPDPLVSLRYPCTYWLRHLCVSMASFDPSDGKVLTFLKEHILHWLEVMSLMRNSIEGVPDVLHFEGLLEQHDPDSQLLPLVHDIRRFTQHNSWIINNAPLQIYLSAILFTPKLSIVRSLFEEELLSWITVKPFVESHWSPCLQTIEVDNQPFNCCFALSTDKKMLASALFYKDLTLWDVPSGKHIRTLENAKGIRQVVFSRDSRRILAAVDEHVVSWDVASGIAHHRTWSVGALPSMSNDCKFIASRTVDGAIQIQDMDTGDQLYLVQDHRDYGPLDSLKWVKLSNDAKYMAFGTTEATVWDLAAQAKIAVINTNGQGGLCFSSDSTFMAYQSGDIICWHLASRHKVGTLSLEPHDPHSYSLEFSTDSKLLAGGTWYHILVWDIVSGTLLTRLDIAAGFVYSLFWSQDSKMLASESGRRIQLWDMTTLIKPEPVLGISTEYSRLESITINNDYKLVATRTPGVVKVWDTTTGSEPAEFKSERGSDEMAFSPDSKFICIYTKDGITKWDIDSGTEATDSAMILSDREYTPRHAFSTDGRFVAGATAGGLVTIWDMSTGYETVRFTVDHVQILAMAFSNNAQYLSLVPSDGRVGVWDAITGDQIKYGKWHMMDGGEGFRRYSAHRGDPVVAVSNNAGRVLVGYVSERNSEIWVNNEGQKMIRLILGSLRFGQRFGARESYIATWGGYIDLDGLEPDCETLGSYQTVTPKRIRLEGYGLSCDQSWITWNGSHVLWLPVTHRPSTRGNDNVIILPLGLFIVRSAKTMVLVLRFSGPPPT